MNKRPWFATIVAVVVCAAGGWLAGHNLSGQRRSPLASIPTGAASTDAHAISDEEARLRVLQLIDQKLLDGTPTVEVPARTEVFCVLDDDVFGAVMPLETEAISSSLLMSQFRFDLWMILFSPSPIVLPPESTESAKPVTSMKKRQRWPLECEERPMHPEVDTLDFRPSDAKKGEAEAFQRKVW